jgi:hypothetical protein
MSNLSLTPRTPSISITPDQAWKKKPLASLIKPLKKVISNSKSRMSIILQGKWLGLIERSRWDGGNRQRSKLAMYCCTANYLYSFFLLLVLFCWDRVSLCSPTWISNLRSFCLSPSWILGLQVWATTLSISFYEIFSIQKQKQGKIVFKILLRNPGVVACTYNPTLGRWMQEDWEFEANLA